MTLVERVCVRARFFLDNLRRENLEDMLAYDTESGERLTRSKMLTFLSLLILLSSRPKIAELGCLYFVPVIRITNSSVEGTPRGYPYRLIVRSLSW
jgi:hypothetical protein